MSIKAILTDSKHTKIVIYKKSVLYMYIFALMKIIEEFAINILSSKK